MILLIVPSDSSYKFKGYNSFRYVLGLAIAKNIVINHNGKINVQSENGYTTFIVWLNKASKFYFKI